MGLGSTISRSLSVAGSSDESSHRSRSASSTASKTRYGHHPNVVSRAPKAPIVRASTVTSATTMSKLIRSASTASTSRESKPASVSSTIRPPSTASRTSRASTLRASTVTSATSASNFIQSDSSFSSICPSASTPAASTTSLSRSGSKHAPSYFSTAASRLLWGRRPPGHSTLQPSKIESLTHILSLPGDTPMLSSLIGAQGVPVSRSQFSPTPSCFCDTHFWLEQRYIEELTEVVAHEIGPQLDKLRIAPAELISKKTHRILSTLQPYKGVFTGVSITDSSSSSFTSKYSSSSKKPVCSACTLSQLFQNPDAVNALTTCVKSRKHRNRPWPSSMAWFEPCPGKGIDWEAKWKAEGKSMARDRIRVQRWRRNNRLQYEQEQQVPEEQPTTQILGHEPGQGCDFCDNLRLERADEDDLDAVTAEDEEAEQEAWERALVNDSNLDTIAENDHEAVSDDSQTFRATQEEKIIGQYLRSSRANSATTTDSVYRCGNQKSDYGETGRRDSGRESVSVMVYLADAGQQREGDGYMRRGEEKEKKKKSASDWARSYTRLVDAAM